MQGSSCCAGWDSPGASLPGWLHRSRALRPEQCKRQEAKGFFFFSILKQFGSMQRTVLPHLMYQLHLARQDPRFTEYRELTQEAPYPRQIHTDIWDNIYKTKKQAKQWGWGNRVCHSVWRNGFMVMNTRGSSTGSIPSIYMAAYNCLWVQFQQIHDTRHVHGTYIYVCRQKYP